MRSRELHDAVRDLAAAVGALLTRELEAGAELPFDVLEEGDRGGRRRAPVLYRYRPLTADFIAGHWPQARELEAYPRARTALGSGAGPYLRHRGLPGSDADAALRDLVARVFEDATSFGLPEERFARVHAELDATLERSTVRATVIAPVHGVRIASARVELGDGLALARRSAIASPPAALEGGARSGESTIEVHAGDGDPRELSPLDGDGDSREPSPLDVFCVLAAELPLDGQLPVDEARVAFRRVLTSLRLCGAGGTALGPLAWARTDGGAWHPVALGVSARSRPESWELVSSEESELRDLLVVLTRSRHGAAVGWALARFEMGCERALETEALSDYLLGLSALLGEPGDSSEAHVAARLPALCAPADERDEARARVVRAFALERRLVFGAGTGAAPALDSPRALVRDVERDLRALLRDVLCGYLDDDLRALADQVLHGAAPAEAADDEIRVSDTRVAEQDTAEFEAVEAGAVTPSVDWESG